MKNSLLSLSKTFQDLQGAVGISRLRGLDAPGHEFPPGDWELLHSSQRGRDFPKSLTTFTTLKLDTVNLWVLFDCSRIKRAEAPWEEVKSLSQAVLQNPVALGLVSASQAGTGTVIKPSCRASTGQSGRVPTDIQGIWKQTRISQGTAQDATSWGFEETRTKLPSLAPRRTW